MTNKNPSKSFQKYAKAIGVNINEKDEFLKYIADSGYNEELKLDYSYEIINSEIGYRNIDTSVTYEIHPNYKTYRKIVSNYKEQQLSKISEVSNAETSKNDKINILKNDQIDEFEKKLKKLDYQTELELLKSRVKKACEQFSNDDNLLKLSDVIQIFEELDKCKRLSKTLVKITQVHLEKSCDEIKKLERSCNENPPFIDEDDIDLKVKCFSEKEMSEFIDENLESCLPLKSIRK